MGDPEALRQLHQAAQQVTSRLTNDLGAQVLGIVKVLLEVAGPVEGQPLGGWRVDHRSPCSLTIFSSWSSTARVTKRSASSRRAVRLGSVKKRSSATRARSGG